MGAAFLSLTLVGALAAGTSLTVERSRSMSSATSVVPDMVSVPESGAQSPESGESMTQFGRRTRPKRSAAWGP
ncbi:hypothetical protein SNARM312S_04798 [Streptomyces narbonensis]